MEELKQCLCLYLKERQEKFIFDWKKRIIVHNHDPHKDEILKNGILLLESFVMYMKEEVSLKEIEGISKKIAQQRIEAKVNIAEFVHNTLAGKTEIMNILPLLNPNLQEYQEVVKQINKFFDQLIYYTVYSYYELKS